MALKDNPGVMRMPATERDWAKFILDLSDAIAESDGSGGGSGDFVTLDTGQTITGLKDFTTAPTINSEVVWEQSNVGTQLNALTETLAPSGSTDYTMIYDASEDEPRKVLLDNLPGGGGGSSDDDELLHHWFD